MASYRRLSILFGLSFIWIMIVLGGYFVYHKPFTPEQLLAWIRAFFQTIVGLSIIACAGGLGEKIFSHFFASYSRSVIQSVGLGLGFLGTIYLVVGWVIGVEWIWSVLLIGLLVFGCNQEIAYWLKSLFQLAKAMAPSNRFSISLAILMGFLLVCSWLTAVAPPLAFDSLVYHLSLPMSYLQAGKFHYVPNNTFWGMPQLGEMLYTIAISIAGVEAGQVLGWIIGVLSLFGIGELIKDQLSREHAWVALSAVLCGITFADSLGWGYVDWITFFWGVCVLQTFFQSISFSGSKGIFLCGLFCGFALGTKVTAGILILAAGIAIIFFFLRPSIIGIEEGKKDFRPSIISLMTLLGLGCFLAVLPWWLKNWLAVGQPFYPLLFPAGEMAFQRIRFYEGIEPFGEWWVAILLPISSTMMGIEGKEGFNASIGPLFLLLAPISFLSLAEQEGEAKHLIRLNILFALSGWIIWGIGSRLSGYLIQSRLYWSIFPSLAVLSGFGYCKLSSLRLGTIRLRVVLNSIILMVLSLTVVEIFSMVVQKKVLDFINGQMNAPTYLKHNLGWHYVALDAIRKQEDQSQTLLLFEPRSLYCLPNCDGDELLDEWYFATLGQEVNGEEIVAEWKERGYQFVLIFHSGAEFVRKNEVRYLQRQWDTFDQLISSLAVKQTFGEAYTLYQFP